MKDPLTRRNFIQRAAAGSAALAYLGASTPGTIIAGEASKPALLGGTPVHKGGWPGWPAWKQDWEAQVLEVLRSGRRR